MIYKFNALPFAEGKRTFIEIPFNVWEETGLKGNIPCRVFLPDVSFACKLVPKGQGRYFIPVPRSALPAQLPEEEYEIGMDDSAFYLNDLRGMNVSDAVAERGHKYYTENRVRYLCVDGTQGFAIVEGGDVYEVEFTCRGGEISNLLCSCFCSGGCKHEFAAMLQLSETMETIQRYYEDEYERTDYFAAVCKGTLFAYAIDGRENGSFTL